MKYLFTGLVFSVLWASASVATKVGVQVAPPLILANIRFFIAGGVLLGYSYLSKKNPDYRLPTKSEWKQLSIFGLLNTTLYLGLYVFAMEKTAAGIGSLAVSTNPLIIVILSAVYLGRKPSVSELFAIALGMAGIAVASWPLVANSYSTIDGIVLLMGSMIVVSCASVYYASVNWRLPNLLINGWQVLLGGVFLLPVTLFTSNYHAVTYNTSFFFSVLWLSLAVSVVGLICWFYLLRIDTVKASLWLFLCPFFGFFFAWWLMEEPITIYTILGTLMVIAALYLGQRYKIRGRSSGRGIPLSEKATAG
ncbi:DMT family transporter [Pedobacter sp. SYSU D00535]|uniref:DMT family transporter n=1 Tax=Pedobacter sp. SYSU D00535 TaxID=2810308 RepID=UPI001A976DBA|nr:EamA family transporter [Pedobacter sp. SYSU D00535]